MAPWPSRPRWLKPSTIDSLVAVALVIDVVATVGTDGRIGALPAVGAIVAATTVAFRRRRPMAALLLAGVGGSVASAAGAPILAMPFVFALDYYALGHGPAERDSTVLAALLLVAPLPAIATSSTTAHPGDILIVDVASIWIFFMVLPFMVGRVVASRRRLIDAVRANVQRLADEQHESERRAAADERTRIARELHDVIAHSVSVMVIQTQAARLIAPGDPQSAVAALQRVEQCGRDALFDVRRMIGVLRRDDDPLSAVVPGVDQLGDLIERTRLAGLPVVLSINGTAKCLAPDLDLVVYRLVQEALTNSLKHAGPARARVALTFSPDRLEVDVVDTGRGAEVGARRLSTGHGLVGMRERLALFEGRLEAGPLQSGGYRVHAAIPLAGVAS